MREIIKVDSLAKALSFLSGLSGLAFMIYGLYGESYWAGFGLVLLMPSLILLASLSGSLKRFPLQGEDEHLPKFPKLSPAEERLSA